MAQAYFSLVTNAGKIKLAQSAAGGDPIVITHFAIGDGNGADTNPTAASIALVREVWRTQVESVVTDPDNPSAILVTAIIPTNVGGWWMREFGIFDQAGAMIAVARPVSQYKPTALEGQLEDIRYEFQIIIGENANVTLLVDPSIIYATRAWVENRKITMSQLSRLPWVPVLSVTLSSAPGLPVQGDAYLIPTGATGIWSAQIGKIAEWTGSAWSYLSPPDGHGIGLPDGRILIRIAGVYVDPFASKAEVLAGILANKWVSPKTLADALSVFTGPVDTGTITYLNIYPHVLTADNKPTIAASGGTIVVTPLKWIWRQHKQLDLATLSVAARTFATDPSKTYHLRLAYDPATGVQTLSLKDTSSPAYNPSALSETNSAFDSTYDDVLLALVTTNAANVATIRPLKNAQRLAASASRTSGTFNASAAAGFVRDTITLDWARLPHITLEEMNSNLTAEYDSLQVMEAGSRSRYSFTFLAGGTSSSYYITCTYKLEIFA